MKFVTPLLLIALVAGPARAGVYNTADNDFPLSQNVAKFRETLSLVRSIGYDKVDFDNPLRKRYFLWEALGGARPPADLTVEQNLDYSAVLIRRKKFQQAIVFLTPLVRRHPDVFLFESHLAMADWGVGNGQRAVESLTNVLSKRSWPENFSDLSEVRLAFMKNTLRWSEHEFGFHRRMETYLLRLMKLRLAEPPGVPFKAVDALFDDGQKPPKAVRFVAESGKFEPGKIASVEKKKLPGDAVEIVEQLLLWLPDDPRLFWLLGELANAQGTADGMKAAHQMFDELVYIGTLRVEDLRERRQILLDHLKSIEQEPPTDDGFPLVVEKPTKKDDRDLPTATRTIAITFVTGFAAGIFAVWQFQEIRRRRRGG